MTRYVLDSYALTALFKYETGKELVVQLLKQAVGGTAELHISSINIGELFYMLCRKNSRKFADRALEDTLKFPMEIHEPALNETLFAARLKAVAKLSFADTHAAALAIRLKATLITGDNEFDNLKNEQNFKVKYL